MSRAIQDQTNLLTQSCSSPAYLPVVVHVTQLVSKTLHVIRLQSTGVIHNIVVGRGDTSSADSLAYDVEVIPGKQRLQHFAITANKLKDAGNR